MKLVRITLTQATKLATSDSNNTPNLYLASEVDVYVARLNQIILKQNLRIDDSVTKTRYEILKSSRDRFFAKYKDLYKEHSSLIQRRKLLGLLK
jgi:hypothetical protein